jgi:uncharacterized protein YbjT (DUF2867 family)
MQKTILVTGATGNVGRHVVTGLLGARARVRALTRNPDSARLPAEVEVVAGDLSDARIFASHLDGVDAVFLVCRTPPTPGLIDAIAKHCRQIVFLSSSAIRDGVERQPNFIGQMHVDIERSIEQSGLEWTFLRPGAFASNSVQWWAPQIRAGDVVRWPYGSASMAPIDERDIASVAVRVLTTEGHAGAKYFLTGPESVTQSEQVRTIGEAIGRPLRLEEIAPAEARQQLQAVMPPRIVEMLLEVWERAASEPAQISPAVSEITGSPGHSFQQWASNHTRDFIPNSGRHDADH